MLKSKTDLTGLACMSYSGKRLILYKRVAPFFATSLPTLTGGVALFTLLMKDECWLDIVDNNLSQIRYSIHA